MINALSSAGSWSDPSCLSQAEDDFSIKLTMKGDPRFWWRVEKTGDDCILITDFAPGGQSPHMMATALALLIEPRKDTVPLKLVFHDLVPKELEPGAYRIELNRVAQAVQSWSEEAARLVGLEVGSFKFNIECGKSQMIVMMHREAGD